MTWFDWEIRRMISYAASIAQAPRALYVPVPPAVKRGRGMPALIEPSPKQQRMIELYKSGLVMEDVGQQIGVTRQRVEQVLRRWGVDKGDGGAPLRSLLTLRDRAAKARSVAAATERRLRQQTGMTLADWLAHVAEWGNANRRGSPYERFMSQRGNSRKRGIAWNLTFAEWWTLWQDSGKWAERGRGQGYCMARHGDSGGYSAENVYICTIGQNFSDSYLTKPATERIAKKRARWDREGKPERQKQNMERNASISVMYARGAKVKAIAVAHGISQNNVYRICYLQGTKRRAA